MRWPANLQISSCVAPCNHQRRPSILWRPASWTRTCHSRHLINYQQNKCSNPFVLQRSTESLWRGSESSWRKSGSFKSYLFWKKIRSRGLRYEPTTTVPLNSFWMLSILFKVLKSFIPLCRMRKSLLKMLSRFFSVLNCLIIQEIWASLFNCRWLNWLSPTARIWIRTTFRI